jgi:hypothetical protein
MTDRGTAPTMAEGENAWAGQGAVLLDIGGDVGGLVVGMPASTVGLEVEIRPLDGNVHAHAHVPDDSPHDHGHEHLAHVAVVARPVGAGRMPSLVFGELQTGSYELFEKGSPDDVALRVEVAGGAVTTADWPR